MKPWILLCVGLVLAGCADREVAETEPSGEIRLTDLSDTTGIAEGQPLLAEVEPYRMPNGALRVRGRIAFPNGTRLQISIYDLKSNEMLTRFQTIIEKRCFDSPPVVGPNGPLPRGTYRFEFLAHFSDAWQTPEVLESTDRGRKLRGPGVTRDRLGHGAFYLIEERRI